MTGPVYGDNAPIAAPATAPAESALAIIRTSGSKEGGESAIELLAKIFSRPEKLLAAPPNSVVHGWIVDRFDSSENTDAGSKKIDEVLVSVYRSPMSYTGEDSADISCHGGIATVRAVMAALKKAGFREALPGEFSLRAFMNGKIDFTRAESVMEIVGAKTERGREQALYRLSGALEKEISAIKGVLLEVLAGVEIYLDYPDDEFENTGDNDEVLPGRKLAEEAVLRLKTISENWRRERLYAEGALAVLAGRPNAGKSSLFNYLLGEDRSIVTNTPGTTRDWIEALISIEGIPLRLADTAGLKDLAESEEAERIGVERSMELLRKADLVLYVINGNEGIDQVDWEFFSRHRKEATGKLMLIIWNKSDLAHAPLIPPEELPAVLLAVSAKTGAGIQDLTSSISRLLEAESDASPRTDAAAPGTLRQKELVDRALVSAEEALLLADRGEPLDLIAPLLRSALDALGEITGEVYDADILALMFSRFCVGK